MVKYFNDIEEFYDFFHKHNDNKMTFNGSESICYLSNDGFVYKNFLERSLDVSKCNLIDSLVICDDDVSTEQIIFPSELYSIEGRIVASKERYVPSDILRGNYKGNFLNEIDYDKLIDAYYRLLSEVKLISGLGIRMNDVDFNILFDNEYLSVVDTYHYFKYGKDCSIYNINLVNNAVKRQLEYGLILSHDNIDNFGDVYKLDVEDYIKVYKKKYTK